MYKKFHPGLDFCSLNPDIESVESSGATYAVGKKCACSASIDMVGHS
jgi:hypothetical protein